MKYADWNNYKIVRAAFGQPFLFGTYFALYHIDTPLMRLSVLVIFLYCISMPVFTNAQNYHWDWAAGGKGAFEGWDIAVDNSGNVYGAGSNIADTVIFGTDTFANLGIPSTAALVAKYNPFGNFLWASKTENAKFAIPLGLATDTSDNLYLFGKYGGDLKIGSIALSNPSPDKAGEYFLAKYSPLGVVEWIINVGNSNFNYVVYWSTFNGIASDGQAIYITAAFNSAVMQIGGTTLVNKDPSGTTYDVFTAKISLSGNIVWAKSLGGSQDDFSTGVAVTPGKNVYVTGYFTSDSVTFGGTTLLTDSVSYNGGNVFLAKYDQNGNPLWAQNPAGNGNFSGGVATDALENAFIVGTFYNKISFGTDTFTDATSAANLFLAKYNAPGDLIWAKKVNGSCSGYAVVTDICGNVWVSGGTGADTSSVIIDTTVLKLPTGTFDPMFLGCWNTTGTYLSGLILPSAGDDLNAIATDRVGNIFLSGDYTVSPFVFDSAVQIIDSTVGIGNEYFFISKYNTARIIDTNFTRTDYPCLDQVAMLYAPAGYPFCRWNDGSEGYTHKVDSNGTFWVYCSGNCSLPVEIDTFLVTPSSTDISFSLGKDTIICNPVVLTVPVNSVSYLWQDSSVNNSYTATVPGVYYVTVSDQKCSFTDSITLKSGDCHCSVFLPTAFTPNSDGRNDFFLPHFFPGVST